jgi:hypothetical protein
MCVRTFGQIDAVNIKDGTESFRTDLNGHAWLLSASDDGRVALIGRPLKEGQQGKECHFQIIDPRGGNALDIEGTYIDDEGCVSADGVTVAVAGKQIVRVLQRDTNSELWRKQAIAYCDSLAEGNAALTMTDADKSMLNEQTAARTRQQLVERQDALNTQEAQRNAELDQLRRQDEERAESGPGTPRAVANALLDSLKQHGVIRAAHILKYFDTPNHEHEWDRFPSGSGMKEIGIQVDFEYDTQAGMVPGYLILRDDLGWKVEVGCIDGHQEIPGAVLEHGGFYFKR